MPNLNPLRVSPKSETQRQRGQVIIEYILLLIVAMGLATIIMKSIVKRDPNEAGFLMERWQAMIDQIAKDDPNKRGP